MTQWRVRLCCTRKSSSRSRAFCWLRCTSISGRCLTEVDTTGSTWLLCEGVLGISWETISWFRNSRCTGRTDRRTLQGNIWSYHGRRHDDFTLYTCKTIVSIKLHRVSNEIVIESATYHLRQSDADQWEQKKGIRHSHCHQHHVNGARMGFG